MLLLRVYRKACTGRGQERKLVHVFTAILMLLLIYYCITKACMALCS